MGYSRPTLSFSIDPKLPESAGCCFQTLHTLQNLRNRFLELPAIVSQIFPFLIIRNFRIFPSNASNCPKPSKPARRAASSGRPNLSFFISPKLPDTPFKRSKPSETSNPALGGATKPTTPFFGATKPWTVGGHVFSFLLTYLTSFKPVQTLKPAKPALGAARLWQAKSFLLYWPETPAYSLQTLQTIRNLRNRLLELYPYWPKTAGCFLQTLQTLRNLPNRLLELPAVAGLRNLRSGSWSCQLWQAKSFLFYWPETAGCFLQTVQTFRNLPNRLLELPAVAS